MIEPFSDFDRMRHVVLQRTGESAIRSLGSQGVLLNDRILRGRRVVQAVATVAGRQSPATVEVPPVAVQRAAAASPSIAEARRKGRLILIAEDDSTNQAVILRQLALMGHTAEVANNGIEALDMWREGCYCLLLTDLHMPEMDGYELVRQIRRYESEETRIPIVALTADALPAGIERARAHGMDDVLTKPLQLADLQKALNAWLPGMEQTAKPPPLPPAAHKEESIDLGVLAGIVGDDPEIMADIIGEFRNSAARIGLEMESALQRDQQEILTSLAHRLKSSSRTVGAMQLGNLCAELENAGRARAGEKQVGLGETLRRHLAQVLQDIDALLATPPGDWSFYQRNGVQPILAGAA